MTDFTHITDWTLKVGSHEFPGPDGGTCINEAAIVAGGFAYRKIESVEDMPDCTSRVIAAYALALNDNAPDVERQKLMVFVTRILGTADTPAVERQRAEFIAIQTVKRILPPVLRAVSLKSRADQCAGVQTLAQARAAADAAAAYAAAAHAADAAYAAAAHAAYAARAAAHAAAHADAFPEALQILDGAMKIGRQPEPLDVAEVHRRMQAALPSAEPGLVPA